MSERKLPCFIALGEALTDMLRCGPEQWRSACGGAPWNVARALARLGLASAFGGAVSRDVLGQALWDASAAAGLDMRFMQQVERAPLLAMVHETAPPQYFFVGENSADLYFDAALLPAGWQQGAHWALLGGISLARQPLAGHLLAQAEALKAAGCRIAYDPNFRSLMAEGYAPMLAAMCRLADAIKVSDEDLRGLFPDGDPQQALARIQAWNPEALILLTSGAAGASLHHRGQVLRTRAPDIEVVDTVGAGDAAMAGLLFSLMRQPAGEPAQHLRSAVAAGTLACLQSGAGLLTADALAAWAERISVA